MTLHNHNSILYMWMCTHTHTHICACSVNSFNTAPTRQGSDYQIFQNIEQYPYSLKFLQVFFFFCYSSYTWAAHLPQKYSIWIISFSCWVRGITAPFYVCQVFLVSTSDDEGLGSLDQESSQMKKLLQDKQGSGDTTMVNAHPLEGVFMKISRLGTTFLNC